MMKHLKIVRGLCLRRLLTTGFLAAGVIGTTSPLLAVTVGQPLPELSLNGNKGGRVDGKPWSSNELKGKVDLVLYVDPDEKDSNTALEKALKDAGLPREKFASVAVINMDATWLPNVAIQASLKSKQEKYPDTVYVRDLEKSLVKSWQLKDDAYVVVAVDQQGQVFFQDSGKFDQAKISGLIEAIKAKL